MRCARFFVTSCYFTIFFQVNIKQDATSKSMASAHGGIVKKMTLTGNELKVLNVLALVKTHLHYKLY